ncbi:MAG: xanthine dehydrogenase small subunit [Caulobacterales bacterium]|nr:xanthine dehydrogenase small subunit [Caulobacterales bacterium]
MTDVIRFGMDGEAHELTGVDPTLTVLNLLRYELRRTGAKEGCAEGDCGACTVALGTLDGDRVRYEAVNACILFAPVLDGKELVTVESLAPRGSLHPVQQAMVDRHGSQCGFCTPGFVMSLFALHEQPAGEETPNPADVVAGNLCRCTGYGPILDAARDVVAARSGAARHADARTVSLLRSVGRTDALSLSYDCPLTGETKRWFAPRTVDELAGLAAAHPDAVILAGATDVGLWVTKQHRTLPTIISLSEVAALRAVRDEGDHILIGAGARYVDAARALAALFPDFGEVIRRLGSVQIRNSGTIGGNIANGSPIGDSPPPLIALGAELVLRHGADRRTLPLEDFFLAYGRQDRRPGEIVEAIRVPKPAPGRLLRAYKISKRFDQDISALLGAFSLSVEEGVVREARIAFGGMAATPKRAHACETALIGAPWTEATVEAACAALASDFSPITDMRASAAYRAKTAANLLRKVYLEDATPAAETRLVGAAAHG